MTPIQSHCTTRHPAGEPARDRLLHTGLRLFAEQGYAKTSIRQISVAAGTNIAAISYYFGDKAGLYRAVFFGGPVSSAEADPQPRRAARSSGAAAHPMAELFEHILEPLKSGDSARHWIKLQRREMLEPSGLWREKMDRGLQPSHAALVAYLCDRLGVEVADDEINALAVMVIAPAVHLLVNCEVVDALAPQLLANAAAIDAWRERLVRSADAMIEAERRRRRTAKPAAAAAGAAAASTPGHARPVQRPRPAHRNKP